MTDALQRFERIARQAFRFSEREEAARPSQQHPFELRDIHADFPPVVRQLFDDGYYAQSTFEAFKFLDKLVQHHAKIEETGSKLMMLAFDKNRPLLKLTPLSNVSEKDEQEGFRFVFAGAIWAIRNRRGHEVALNDDVDLCLDHLAFASMLLRRLESAGYVAAFVKE